MKSIQYLAGLFDGEGSFSIQVKLRSYDANRPSFHFSPTLSVHLYYGAEVLDNFVSTFGGKIYTHGKGGARWYLGTRTQTLAAATALLPELVIKKNIAERFIEAIELAPKTGGGADRRAGQRVWSIEQCLAVAEIALSLNPPRSRKSNKTAEYVETLRAALTLVPIEEVVA